MSSWEYAVEVKGMTPCKPWKGNFDLDTLQCLNKDGSVHLKGKRLCGKADCVNTHHIELEKPIPTRYELLAEQFSISYRTGKKKTYQELMKTLRREQNEVTKLARAARQVQHDSI